MKAHLTTRYINSLKPPATGRTKLYDDTLAGFGLVLHPTGKRVFFIEYGPATKRRRMNLGTYGPYTVEDARNLAAKKLVEINEGADPLAQRAERRAMPTWGAWREEYMREVRGRKKRPDSDERFLTPRSTAKKRGPAVEQGHPVKRLADEWCDRKIDTLTRRDVLAGMAAIRDHGQSTSANRWLASVRACFAAAVLAELIASNPASKIKPGKENPPRDRVLTDAELSRVVDAFDQVRDPYARAGLLLLLDTGARRSEVLRARWDDFDLDGATWRLPATKAGQAQVIPLAPGTVALLRTVPRLGEWFLPGRDSEQHRHDLRTAWEATRTAAAISGVTIHDLRRTFGLHVAKHAGIHVASKLLRHSDIRVTVRVYAPLGVEDLRAGLASMHNARSNVIELERARAR